MEAMAIVEEAYKVSNERVRLRGLVLAVTISVVMAEEEVYHPQDTENRSNEAQRSYTEIHHTANSLAHYLVANQSLVI